MNRQRWPIDEILILADLAWSRNKMPCFDQSIARFSALPCLHWLAVLAALVTVAAPAPANAGTRMRAAGAYDGTWNVVFATTRGNCSSGHSVPFTVSGSRVSSAGGGQGLRLGQPRRRRGRSRVGWRLQGERRRPACRHQRRGIMERHHYRGSLQRYLAGRAELKKKSARQIA
jgi:hypothetical protein